LTVDADGGGGGGERGDGRVGAGLDAVKLELVGNTVKAGRGRRRDCVLCAAASSAMLRVGGERADLDVVGVGDDGAVGVGDYVDRRA
jgi:hypothetical protein